MVNILLVSHSQRLATSVAEVAALMAKTATIKAVGGKSDGSFGADEERITKAIIDAYTDDGVVVIADIGSSVNTVKAVIKKMEEQGRANVKLADCPMIEGAIAAAVMAGIGMPMEEVIHEAEDAKKMKK